MDPLHGKVPVTKISKKKIYCSTKSDQFNVVWDAESESQHDFAI